MTSLYGSKHSSAVFWCKRATLGQELHISVEPRPHLSFCAYKTAWLAPELLFSMGPSRHQWFLNAKQRLLDQNHKSLWVLDLNWRFVHAKQRLWTRITSLYGFKLSYVFLCIENSYFRTKIACLYGSQTSPVILFMQNRVPSISPSWSCPHLWFCMENSDFWARITNLYWSQTSPVVLCLQYSVISTRITCLYGSQPLSVDFAYKTATFGAELQVSMGPRHNLSFCACKRACLAPEILVSMGPSPHLWFLHEKQRPLDQN